MLRFLQFNSVVKQEPNEVQETLQAFDASFFSSVKYLSCLRVPWGLIVDATGMFRNY
jgi:hypothetical protein